MFLNHPSNICFQMYHHGSHLESIYKVVSMDLLPTEYLPDDYSGPTNGTKQEIIGRSSHILVAQWNALKYICEFYPADNIQYPIRINCESQSKTYHRGNIM